MLVILGKTASGKTTIVEKLVKEHGFKQVVTYTTRPMRAGETDGVTYHYEIKRRILRDNEDFTGLQFDVERIIYNNRGANLDNVVDKILKFMNGLQTKQ